MSASRSPSSAKTGTKTGSSARSLLSDTSFKTAVSRLMPSRRGFPWRSPSWPTSIVREAEKPTLGIHYDTEWSRKYPARLARAALLDWVSSPLVKAVAPAKVKGTDRFDTVDAPVIFAANHSSHIDTVVLLTSLPDRFRHKTVVAAGADYFFDMRWKAAMWSLTTAAIPIERTKVNRQSADLAAGLLAEGWNLVIYPEGGRSPDGWAQPFRAGAAYLSKRVGAPVVPIYIHGTRHVLPKDAGGLRHSETRVVFGSPLVAGEDEDARQFAVRIEDAVAVLADETTSDWWTARKNAARGRTPSMRGPTGAPWRRSWELEARKSVRSR